MPSISFVPTEADVVAANRLWFWHSIRKRRTVIGYACLLILAIAFALYEAEGASLSTHLIAIGIAIAYVAIIFVAMIGTCALLVPSRARKSFRQHKALHSALAVSWSDDNISFETANAYSRHQWSDFVRFMEGESVFLLFQTDRLFNYIPKAVLSPDELNNLRLHLHAR